MKTAVIGFPRIGTLRELKFASENILGKRSVQKNCCRQQEH